MLPPSGGLGAQAAQSTKLLDHTTCYGAMAQDWKREDTSLPEEETGTTLVNGSTIGGHSPEHGKDHCDHEL